MFNSFTNKSLFEHFNKRIKERNRVMQVHELKILPKYLDAIVSGEKRFELRKNDRDYQVGDILCLREYDGEYTGREKYYSINYILKDCPEYGLMDGYCILGL